MTAERVETFRNTRCRVLPLSEGRWHPGWTLSVSPDEARLRLKTFDAFGPDAEVVGECYGEGTLVRFAGRVVGQTGRDLAIRVAGALAFEAHRESVRIAAEGIAGTLRTGAGDFDLLLNDVSPESLGGLTAARPEVGTLHGLTVRVPDGTIECRVGVASVLPDEAAGAFRIGLRIVDIARLDAARWLRFLEDRAEV